MDNCIEIKENLLGNKKEFPCELVHLKDNFGLLRYIVKNKKNIKNTIIIPAKTITYAFYWTDRSYNIYVWFSQDKKVLGYYFNIVGTTKLNRNQFYYYDLLVDIIIFPNSDIKILDKEELPQTLDKKTKDYIEKATLHIIQNHKEIIKEIKNIINKFNLV